MKNEPLFWFHFSLGMKRIVSYVVFFVTIGHSKVVILTLPPKNTTNIKHLTHFFSSARLVNVMSG